MSSIDRRLTHWGEAAFYFSLDLSRPILTFLLPHDLDLQRVKEVFRQSILQNREAITAGNGNFYFQDLIAWNAPNESWVPVLTQFVQTGLVTNSYPEHRQNIPERFLRDDLANDQITKALGTNIDDKSFRQRYHEALSQDDFNALFAAVIGVDAAIEAVELSKWDGEILVRNREIYGLTDPLRNLVSSADMVLRKQAIMQVLADNDGGTFEELLAMEAAL